VTSRAQNCAEGAIGYAELRSAGFKSAARLNGRTRLELDGKGSKAIAQPVIKQPSIPGDPTRGVFVGNAFFFIPNSG